MSFDLFQTLEVFYLRMIIFKKPQNWNENMTKQQNYFLILRLAGERERWNVPFLKATVLLFSDALHNAEYILRCNNINP